MKTPPPVSKSEITARKLRIAALCLVVQITLLCLHLLLADNPSLFSTVFISMSTGGWVVGWATLWLRLQNAEGDDSEARQRVCPDGHAAVRYEHATGIQLCQCGEGMVWCDGNVRSSTERERRAALRRWRKAAREEEILPTGRWVE